MKVDKVIITNNIALRKKHGKTLPRVKRTIARFVVADRRRGIKTTLVAIDSASHLKKVQGKAIKDKDDQKQAKAAVDAPPKGPNWTKAQLRPRVHFINCHGAPSDPFFYGQRGMNYQEAHSAKKLRRKITNGTVVAVECCYGAELYNPADSDGQAGICSTYLRDGAYGYLGRTCDRERPRPVQT